METESKKDNFVVKEKSPCQLGINNKNNETKKIDVFSDIHENDIVISELGNGNKNNLNGTTTSLMRMQSSCMMEFMFNGFWINEKKYMYIDWFSKFQYQSGIIDLPINISKDIDIFELEIPKKSESVFTFFPNKDYPKIGKYDLPKYQLCVIATNKTEVVKDINILDTKYFPNGFEDEDLKIEIATCYLDNDKKIETKSIGCFTLNHKQLTGTIKLNNDKEITAQNYFDIHQQQSCMIDFDYNETFKVGDKFEVNLLPDSKVMYSFNSSPIKTELKPLFNK